MYEYKNNWMRIYNQIRNVVPIAVGSFYGLRTYQVLTDKDYSFLFSLPTAIILGGLGIYGLKFFWNWIEEIFFRK